LQRRKLSLASPLEELIGCRARNALLRHVSFQPADLVAHQLHARRKFIVTVPDDIRFVTANLLSPIVINMRNKRGKQILLSDTDYPINYRILRDAPVERGTGSLRVASRPT